VGSLGINTSTHIPKLIPVGFTLVLAERQCSENTVGSLLAVPFLVSLNSVSVKTSLHGFTMRLPARLWAAPANSDKIRDPCRSVWVEMYSYAT
jgi:hypothetical protein